MNAPDTPFPFDGAIDAAADRLEPKVVAWRRDFHQNPELGNREVRTAKVVADHLRALGFDSVQEKVAHTGVNGGAKMMVEQGCMKGPDVDAIFGLHVTSVFPTGMIGYRSGPLMASADDFRVFVRGTQTHAAMPWRGVDPIVVTSQIVLGLQTIVSRQMNITHEPSVVTVGVFHGGVRHNIIPDEAKLEGTIRTFDEG